MNSVAELTPLLVVLSAVVGLVIGSFLNVVIYRVPNGMSIVAPASACPNCHSEIQGRDNVPVVSWLVLRGRCRSCRAPISWRYPVVELCTGLLFVAVALFFASTIAHASAPATMVGAWMALLAFLYLAAVTVALSLIDLDVQRLPNVIVLPAYAIGGILLAVSAILQGDPGALVRAGVGMAAMFLFYFGLAFAFPGGMGFGDVKLAGVLGLYLGYLGWEQLVVGTFAAFLVGGVVAVGLLIARRVRRRGGIPFGPWMLAGGWIAIFAGPPIATGYLRLVGLG